jgi:hypothetical protein
MADNLSCVRSSASLLSISVWFLLSTYASEWSTLSASSRASICASLHLLAGSHRGPSSRDEENPLLYVASSALSAEDRAANEAFEAAMQMDAEEGEDFEDEFDEDEEDEDEEEEEEDAEADE